MKDYNKKEVIFGAVEMVDELINLPKRRLGGEIVPYKTMYRKLDELWEYPDNPSILYHKLPPLSGSMRDYFLDRGRFSADAKYMLSVRTRLGLTQDEMAERLGYGYQKDISNIERGEKNMSNQVREHLKTIEKYEITRKMKP